MAMKPEMNYDGPDMPQGAPTGGASEGPTQPPPPEGQGKGGMGPQDVLSAIKTIESAMLAIASSLEKAGAPPEAVQSLQSAISSYGDFVSVITGQGPAKGEKAAPKAPPQAPAQAPAPMETAGAKGAVPAEGPLPPR